jgi:hypothetical protein
MNSALRARDAVVRDDLFTMRTLIDCFTLDFRRAPARLEAGSASGLGTVCLTLKFLT